MSDDAKLLEAYAREGSEPAFRALVGRHIPLVMATARRIVAGDEHLAQDVTQLVFTDLARKAATLPPGVILGGWLHRHTCFTATKAVRTESRRRTRERTAMENDALTTGSARDEQWRQLAPVLDDALNHLDTDDRDAVVLRYFEQRDLRSIGAALGVSDDTAQKRIARALDKLRDILTRRGITLSSTLLAAALDAGAASTGVSSGLTVAISASALSGAATATSATLLTATLKIMTTSKLTLGIAALVVAGTLAFLLTHKQAAPTTITPEKTVAVATPSKKPAPASDASQVEAPKIAPAPAGGGTSNAQPATVTATTGSLSFSSTRPGTLQLVSGTNGTGASNSFAPGAPGVNAAGDPPADWETIISRQRNNIESLKAIFTRTIEEGTAKANGNPDELAKLEPARQQLEYYTQQAKDIDALETMPSARAAYLTKMKNQFAEIKASFPKQLAQTAARANGDPAILAQVEEARRQFAIVVQKQEQAFAALAADQLPLNHPSDQVVLLASKRADLETFKSMTQNIIAQATLKANGDPAELAKVEAARQQYDNYAQQKQREIDMLEAQPAK